MRKIRKLCHLSIKYKTWHDAIEAAQGPHPKYNSSKNEFYWDVVMNLLHCQGGLCAYTEMLLCSDEMFNQGKWSDGCYAINPEFKPQTKGQLEHFDRTLKDKKAWLWNNLFMVDTDINTKVKGTHSVDPILKPDADDYDEFQKLDYDFAEHIFIANVHLPEDIRARVTTMIITLGINFGPVKAARRRCLERIVKLIEFGIESWSTISVDEFPTACEMLRRRLNNSITP
ncbi:MAG TPA: hypothetical protein VH595_00845 [Verrucomicrobiae bacterium]|jgi:hypothetical protein|nr:hypothetical protein [Verrucomicrobiae bacterium]